MRTVPVNTVYIKNAKRIEGMWRFDVVHRCFCMKEKFSSVFCNEQKGV